MMFLAEKIKSRMDELGLDQIDLSRQADVADATVRHLQAGDQENYRRSTLAKVSRALGWQPSRITTFLETGEWPDQAQPAPAALSGKLAQLSGRDRQLIERLVDEMLQRSDVEAAPERPSE